MGGFPKATRRAPRRRAAFLDSYLSTLIERDVLELASIERRGDLLTLIALLAGRAGGLLEPAALAAQSGIREPHSCVTWNCWRRSFSSKALRPGHLRDRWERSGTQR